LKSWLKSWSLALSKQAVSFSPASYNQRRPELALVATPRTKAGLPVLRAMESTLGPELDLFEPLTDSEVELVLQLKAVVSETVQVSGLWGPPHPGSSQPRL